MRKGGYIFLFALGLLWGCITHAAQVYEINDQCQVTVHEILKAKPRSVQPGIAYIEHGDLIGDWSDLEYISVLFQKPHGSYLFIKLDYHPKTFCIDKLYACKVTKLEDHVFDLYSVEGKINEILDLLYSFSIH